MAQSYTKPAGPKPEGTWGGTPAPNPTQSTALARIETSHLPTWAAEAVGDYIGRTDVNLLLPTMPQSGSIAYAHVPRVSIVRIDPNKDNGDVYPVDGGRLALTKPALNRLANAGGIQYRTRRVDDRSNPRFCEYECESVMRSESGEPLVRVYHKSIDMDRKEASIRARQTDAAKAAKEIAQFFEHMEARCETGAINRAIRGQFGLKAGYSAADLMKPFVVLRVDFQPDASDPVAKRFMLERGDAATRALFGSAPRRPIEGRAEVVDPGDDFDDEDDLPVGFTSDAGGESAVTPSAAAAEQGAPLPQSEMLLGDEVTRARKAFFAEFNQAVKEGRVPKPADEDAARTYVCGLLGRPTATRALWTAEDWREARLRLPVADSEHGTDYFRLVEEGCAALGISTAEKNALFREHAGDIQAIYTALNKRANERAA